MFNGQGRAKPREWVRIDEPLLGQDTNDILL